jgi:hypothetical protein
MTFPQFADALDFTLRNTINQRFLIPTDNIRRQIYPTIQFLARDSFRLDLNAFAPGAQTLHQIMSFSFSYDEPGRTLLITFGFLADIILRMLQQAGRAPVLPLIQQNRLVFANIDAEAFTELLMEILLAMWDFQYTSYFDSQNFRHPIYGALFEAFDVGHVRVRPWDIIALDPAQWTVQIDRARTR